VRLAGRNVAGVPAFERPVNMVFQHYALFPHLTVAQNIAYGLRYRTRARTKNNSCAWPTKPWRWCA
jgi:ABC-type Fe3+/spermidine/putrescine transport system ATPase subunit